MVKEWLIRKSKKHYIGPFDASEVKKLIRELEVGGYDEISRSAQPWHYLKDCPPFIKLVEDLIPHAQEEKTIRLSTDETTSVTAPGVPSKLPKIPPSKKIVELERGKPRRAEPKSAPLYKWMMGLLSAGFIIAGLWIFFPERQREGIPIPESPTEGAITEPQLKELTETFKQFNLLFYQGKLEESAGEYRKAIALYQQALKYNAHDIKAQIRLAALEFHVSQDIQQARKKLIDLSELPNLERSEAMEIQNHLGLLALKEKQYVKAAQYFLGALNFDNAFAPAHFNLGYSYFFQKQYYNARQHFDKAVRLQPNLPVMYMYLGQSLQKLNKDEAAIREYTNANRINPNLAQPYLSLSLLYLKMEQPAKAFFYLEEMGQRHPEYEAGYYKDIRYMWDGLDYDAVSKAFSFVLNQKQISAKTWAALAWVLFMNGQREQAYQWVQKAIRTNFEEASAHAIYGYMLQKDGQIKKAMTSLHAALRYEYQNRLAHLLIAEINIKLGEYQQAVEHCRKILSFDPFSVNAYHILGTALIYLERPSEAVEAFNKALEYDPNYMPAKKMLLQYSQ